MMKLATLARAFAVAGVLAAFSRDPQDACGGSDAPPRPNILLIVSDDQGYGDLGCYGNAEIQTPAIDRLAAGGVRLTSFYVAWPACTPSRASLLTGRYPQRHGLYDMIRNEAPDYGKKYSPEEYAVTFERIAGLDERERLASDLLSDAGYRCGMIGKWDLGMQRRFLPLSRGFEQFYGFVNTGIDYFTHERYGVPSMYRDCEPTSEDRGEYATWLFEREAAEFLRSGDGRPFFLYLAFNAPHSASNLDPAIRGSAQAPEELRKRYWPSASSQEQPAAPRDAGQRRSLDERRALHKAAITGMDQAIGRLLTQLRQQEQTSDTLVIFLSDNGASRIGNNGGLHGFKGDLWEGGVRVPCIVSFPGRFPSGIANDAMLTALDVMPTLLSIAGVTDPESIVLDGVDMTPALTEAGADVRQEMFWQRRDARAARVGQWKWIESRQGGGLFDLSQDAGEQRDLTDVHPEQAAAMAAQFARWRQEMDDAEPRGPFRDY